MLPLVFAATAAAAAAVPINEPPLPPDFDAPPKVRNGLALGLALGGGVFGASGYPNSSSQIGDPRYYSASGLMTGSSTQLLIMGAISDSIDFGFWFGASRSTNANWQSSGSGVGLRVELFPLLRLYPRLAGLGVFGQFGVGIATLKATDPTVPESNGVQSFLETGGFYEWSFGHVLGGHFGAGPSVQYEAIWSRPLERHGATASLRIVFYGGP